MNARNVVFAVYLNRGFISVLFINVSDCLYHTDNRQATSPAGITLLVEPPNVYLLSDPNAPLNLACLYVVRQLVYSFFKYFISSLGLICLHLVLNALVLWH